MCELVEKKNDSSLAAFTDEEKERVQERIYNAQAKNTHRAYDSQFKRFEEFCASRKKPLESLPAGPGTIALYIDYLVANHKSASTINQAMAAIAMAHNAKKVPSPTSDPLIRKSLSGMRREIGTAARKKAALTPDILKAMIQTLNLKTLRGLRDRAILLMGFSGAFRRSELIGLNVDDLQNTVDKYGRRAYVITVRKSKTDQEAAGMQKAIFTAKDKALDPVRALDEYLAAGAIASGAIFRSCAKGNKITAERLSGYSVACIVQQAAKKANVDLDLAAHSLRAGFVTSAIIAGASERSIMNQTGHRSVTVMRGYQRRVDVTMDNAASMIL